jgi:hypothetical protein
MKRHQSLLTKIGANVDTSLVKNIEETTNSNSQTINITMPVAEAIAKAVRPKVSVEKKAPVLSMLNSEPVEIKPYPPKPFCDLILKVYQETIINDFKLLANLMDTSQNVIVDLETLISLISAIYEFAFN